MTPARKLGHRVGVPCDEMLNVCSKTPLKLCRDNLFLPLACAQKLCVKIISNCSRSVLARDPFAVVHCPFQATSKPLCTQPLTKCMLRFFHAKAAQRESFLPSALRRAYAFFLKRFCERTEMKMRRDFDPGSQLPTRRADAQDAVVGGSTAPPIAVAVEHTE